MENENENLDSENEETDKQELETTEEEIDTSEVIALKEKNRQLFARAKKAEGFELKDGKWVKPEPKPEAKTPEKSNEDFGLLEKTYLRAAGIAEEDEVELAKKLKKETGKDLDALIDSNYFKSELENLRTTKANIKATDGVRGGRGETTDKPEHWIAKGVPPTPEQVPDRKKRVEIAKAMISNAKSGKKFYNE